MKALLISFLLVALAGCAHSPAPNSNWRQEGYDKEGQLVAEKVTRKQITVLEGIRHMQAVVKSYFPNDQLLMGVWEDLAQYAQQVEKGEISSEKYSELFDARWALFNDVNVRRHAEMQAEQAQQRQSEFMGNFLSGIASSMQRNNSPVINCATTSMPGVITTNCR